MSGFANYDYTSQYHQTWYNCPECGEVMFINTTCYCCAVKDWQKESSLSVGDRVRLIAMLRIALDYLPRIVDR